MVVLCDSGTITTSNNNNTLSSNNNNNNTSSGGRMMAPLRRKRSSKGQIAGFGDGNSSSSMHSSSSNDSVDGMMSPSDMQQQQQAPSSSSTSSPQQQQQAALHRMNQQQPQQPHHPQPQKQTRAKFHSTASSARLALVCSHNVARMGARTVLALCPPGPNRRTLQAALRQRNSARPLQLPNMTSHNNNNNNANNSTAVGSHGLTHKSNSNNSLNNLNSTASNSAANSNNNATVTTELEQMVGSEQLEDYEVQEEEFLIQYNSNNGGGNAMHRTQQMRAAGNNSTYDDSDEEASSGDEDDLLPMEELFSNDSIPLDDTALYEVLRTMEPLYVPVNMQDANGGGSQGRLPFNRRKVRYWDMITVEDTVKSRAYLRNEWRRSKQRSQRAFLLQQSQQPLYSDALTTQHRQSDSSNSNNCMTPFEHPMTPSMAAALLMESLLLNPKESLEGMAKCYDGIVAAGVAVLDAAAPDPTLHSSNTTPTNATGNTHGVGGTSAVSSSSTTARTTAAARSEIMAALAPLLVTSLHAESGQVILQLARLRRRCGTARYRRRFVQRIAPALIRPGTPWCLQHQGDMEAVLAAAELILDAAFDVFVPGWYDRGRWILADTKRMETLETAAKQLKALSLPSGSFLPHHTRTNSSVARRTKDETAAMAEWEVIAVDQQIRVSISSVLHTDWTLAATVNESVPRPMRRSTQATTVSTTATALPSASPRTPRTSPRARSPRLMQQQPISLHTPDLDLFDRAQTPPPPSSSIGKPESELSPPQNPPSTMPLQPPAPLASSGNLPPPKSPKSPKRPSLDMTAVRKDSSTMSSLSVTPLSPSSTGSSDVLAHRGSQTGSSAAAHTTPTNSSAAPTTPSTTAPTSASTTSHFRMLTSTAAERKRTVAACRALRAQISRFEEAFVQLHGRPPKGVADRAPLATTYAQYREWKRAIRADAACRIQAVYRGASCRWKLLRSGDENVIRLIHQQARRRRQIGAAKDAAAASATPEIERLTTVRRSTSDGSAGLPAPVPGRTSPARSPAAAAPDVAAASTTSPSSVEQSTMSFADLHARKRDLKQQLKQYDMNFAKKYGRMPVKSEKEPIRHLYESYNTLKNQITAMEADGQHLPDGATPAPTTTTPRASSPLPNQRRTVSPPSVSDGSDDSTGFGSGAVKSSPVPTSRSSARKLPKPGMSPPLAGSTSSSSSLGAVGHMGQDLAALRAEKGQLHTMLRSYEKEFFRENERQVSSFTDIKPVAAQYRRYKEIKKAIAAIVDLDK